MTKPAAVPYITRTQNYYTAQGFEHIYRYAHYTEAPFTPLSKPLSECTLGLVTTASTHYRAPLALREVDTANTATPPEKLYTDDLSWDKQATHTDDLNSYCPIDPLKTLVSQGKIGKLAPQFHCAPTEYSQRTTLEKDAPEILRRLQQDKADIALLVPL